MIDKIFTKDWFNRGPQFVTANRTVSINWEDADSDVFSNFLYSEVEALRVLADERRLRTELYKIIHALGLSGINICLTRGVIETARTNGHIIEIDLANIDNMKGTAFMKLDKLFGFLIHECCHCLYTRFDYCRRFNGKYPHVVHYLHNIIEDELIETRLGRRFPGYINYIHVVKEGIFNDSKSLLDACETEVDVILAILFHIIRYPKYVTSVPENVLNKYAKLFNNIYNIMNGWGCFDKMLDDCTYASMRSAIEIYELIKSYIDEKKQDTDSGNGDSASDSNSGSSDNTSKNNSSDNSSESDENSENNDSDNSSISDENNDESNNNNSSNINDNGKSGEEQLDSSKIAEMIKEMLDKQAQSSSECINPYEMNKMDSQLQRTDTVEKNREENKTHVYNRNERPVNVHGSIVDSHRAAEKKYNTIKREISSYISRFKEITIPQQQKKLVLETQNFRRNGTLDPARLAVAMANVNTVYKQTTSRNVNRPCKFALVIMLDESGSMNGDPNDMATRVAVMIYEAMITNPDIEIYVYGHGDVVYRYIDKHTHDKNNIVNRNLQNGQNETESYKYIIDDVRKQTRLPIVAVNITDSYYISNVDEIKNVVNELNTTQNACISVITINPCYVNSYADEFNSNIYGEGNYLNTCSRDADVFNTIAMKLSDIIVKNWKRNMRNAA